jgi:hypothetical protein
MEATMRPTRHFGKTGQRRPSRVDAFCRRHLFGLGERGTDRGVRRQRNVRTSRLAGDDPDLARADRELQGIEQRAAHLQQIPALGERLDAVASERVGRRRARRHRLRREPR